MQIDYDGLMEKVESANRIEHTAKMPAMELQRNLSEGPAGNREEGVGEAVRAQEVIKKLTEYKPLAKVEEMEEQNYNMIDNMLNNGVEKAQREAAKSGHGQNDARVSLIARLAEKKAKIAGQAHDAQEKGNNKNTQKEM